MKIIVGLGNPGAKYEATRHNVGFITADLLADAYDKEVSQKGLLCYYTEFRLNGEKILVVKPQTYMNLSGDCVGQLARYYKVANEDILVISDDLSLPVGTMRFRAKGSSGGHNGLKSIIAHLGGDDFPRLKIGIGRSDDVIDYVLGHFGKEEWEKISEMMQLAVKAVELWITDGCDAVMNRFNVYSKLPKPKKEKKPEETKDAAEKDVPPLIPVTSSEEK